MVDGWVVAGWLVVGWVVDGWMDGWWMDGWWMDGGWIDGGWMVDGWIDGQMDLWMDNGWMDGWIVDGWMGGGWMVDGSMVDGGWINFLSFSFSFFGYCIICSKVYDAINVSLYVLRFTALLSMRLGYCWQLLTTSSTITVATSTTHIIFCTSQISDYTLRFRINILAISVVV